MFLNCSLMVEGSHITAEGEQSMREQIKQELKTIPYNTSGVYLIKDISGNVIYVGQATDLKRRLSSHFRGDKRNNTALWFFLFDSFSYIVESSKAKKTKIEGDYIYQHQPVINKEFRYGAKFEEYMDKAEENTVRFINKKIYWILLRWLYTNMRLL